MKLDNKIAVVTGGASGIGQACCERLQERGVRVVAWDKTKTDSVIECDVSESLSVEKALLATIAREGVPSVVINCAGIAPAQRMVGKEGAMSLAAFKKVIDVNLVGTFNVMRVIAEVMINKLNIEDEERGIIINTASVAAYDGQVGQTAYSASKGGIVAMTLPAARELAQFGIRVNAIAPGLVATPLLLNMPDDVKENLKLSVPFPKRFARPDEFANLAIHIIENAMINGEVIRMDGALRMQ